jgi:hypothetical protein
MQAVPWQAPVLPAHRQLLEAVPVNAMPAVEIPQPEAPVSALREGITVTAQRQPCPPRECRPSCMVPRIHRTLDAPCRRQQRRDNL